MLVGFSLIRTMFSLPTRTLVPCSPPSKSSSSFPWSPIPLFSFGLVSVSSLPLYLNGLLTLLCIGSARDLLNRLEDRLDDVSPILISTAEIGGVTRRSFRRVKRLVVLLVLGCLGSGIVFYGRFFVLREGNWHTASTYVGKIVNQMSENEATTKPRSTDA